MSKRHLMVGILYFSWVFTWMVRKLQFHGYSEEVFYTPQNSHCIHVCFWSCHKLFPITCIPTFSLNTVAIYSIFSGLCNTWNQQTNSAKLQTTDYSTCGHFVLMEATWFVTTHIICYSSPLQKTVNIVSVWKGACLGQYILTSAISQEV